MNREMEEKIIELTRRIIENYCVEFSEEMTLKSDKDFIYLSDLDTYELYYASMPNPDKMYGPWGDYMGKKCYKVLQERQEPCPFCTNSKLSRDQYYIWRYFNPLSKREYLLKDKLVDWHGKTVRMEVVIDITDSERLYKVLFDSLESQNMLMSCIQPLMANQSVKDALSLILDKIRNFFHADWGFIQCFGCNLITVLRSDDGRGCPPIIESTSEDTVSSWQEMLGNGRQMVLKDVELMRETNKEGYDKLKKYGVESCCATPLEAEGAMGGLLVLGNIKSHWEDISMLKMTGTYVASQIRKEELLHENGRILYEDPLTGYQNFTGFKAAAANLLKMNPNIKYSVWYCDIKNFKYINDVFGFDVGNKLLKYWADLISEDTGENETFCRVSADNFSYLRAYEDCGELKERFRKLAVKLTEFPDTASSHFEVEVAAGAYLLEDVDSELMEIDEMINRANMAQKNIKKERGSKLSFYSDEMRRKVVAEMQMEAAMREALRAEEFHLYLQPQVCVSGGDDEECFRAEALVRWLFGNKKYIMPGEFIALFERNGMIVELDFYMLRQACRFLRESAPKCSKRLCIAVNVSRVSMLQPDFIERYSRVKDEYGIGDGMIELEFTESIVVENYSQFCEIMTELKNRGFLCALDDFGTGQSSLNVLQALPIDVLKMDRMFFQEFGDPVRGKTIISCVLQMAEKLNLKTVAEGIEQMEQVEELKQMGCNFIQGYAFSKPMPAEEYAALIGVK